MTSVRVIVLAAQRKGVIDPLAIRFGVSHKCLIPLHKEMLIEHVMKTLTSHPDVGTVAVSIEPEVFDEVATLLQGLSGKNANIILRLQRIILQIASNKPQVATKVS